MTGFLRKEENPFKESKFNRIKGIGNLQPDPFKFLPQYFHISTKETKEPNNDLRSTSEFSGNFPERFSSALRHRGEKPKIKAVKFFADEMLGKLARWLRMSGLDVAYQRQISDSELISRSRNEGRILLTRDTRLIRRLAPEEFLFIDHNDLESQFEQFRRRFPEVLPQGTPFSRCVECNEALQEIPKESVAGKVWPYVFAHQERFTTCPACGRIYWRATHVERIRERLERLFH